MQNAKKRIFHYPSKTHFGTYGSANFLPSRDRLAREAIESGLFDSVRALTANDINQNISFEFAPILNLTRGGGYWLRICFLLKQELDSIRDGEFLVYADAGCTINANGGKRMLEYFQMLHSFSFRMFGFQSNSVENKLTVWRIFEAFDVLGNKSISDSLKYQASTTIALKHHQAYLI